MGMLGAYFFVLAVFLSPTIQWKVFVQSLILLGLGAGGVIISFKGER
jgi:hypothetical protein